MILDQLTARILAWQISVVGFIHCYDYCHNDYYEGHLVAFLVKMPCDNFTFWTFKLKLKMFKHEIQCSLATAATGVKVL